MENINFKPFEIKKVQKIIESKETEDLVRCLHSLEVHASSIGEGGNAEILAMDEGAFSKVCLKRIKEKPQLMCNDIDRENELQGKARKAGVRTPLALISFEANGGKFFIMEKISGYNLEEVLMNPNLLPENFSYGEFIDNLKNQITNMHEAGIYHRDLHLRNVMVDQEGMPIVIDFGTATEGSGSDLTYEGIVTSYNKNTEKYEPTTGLFKDDWEMFDKLKSAIRPFQRRLAVDK